MWKAVRKVLFWRYERGTWQYDVIVAVILAFIFLTPPALFDGSWFRRDARAVEAQENEGIPVVAKPSPSPEETPPERSEERQKGDPPKP